MGWKVDVQTFLILVSVASLLEAVQEGESEPEVVQAVERERQQLAWMFPGYLIPHWCAPGRSLDSHSPS